MTVKRVLYLFWIVIPILIVVSLSLYSLANQHTVLQLLQSVPNIALIFLLCFIFLIYACTLYIIEQTPEYRPYLKSFLLVASIQQIAVFNIVGALLCFHYFRQLTQQKVQLKSLFFASKWLSVIIFVLCCVTVLLMWSLYVRHLIK